MAFSEQHKTLRRGLGLPGAYLQYLAWPVLCKTLIAYALGARVPVVVIMFFALRGH
jgi:hypothetical protein